MHKENEYDDVDCWCDFRQIVTTHYVFQAAPLDMGTTTTPLLGEQPTSAGSGSEAFQC